MTATQELKAHYIRSEKERGGWDFSGLDQEEINKLIHLREEEYRSLEYGVTPPKHEEFERAFSKYVENIPEDDGSNPFQLCYGPYLTDDEVKKRQAIFDAEIQRYRLRGQLFSDRAGESLTAKVMKIFDQHKQKLESQVDNLEYENHLAGVECEERQEQEREAELEALYQENQAEIEAYEDLVQEKIEKAYEEYNQKLGEGHDDFNQSNFLTGNPVDFSFFVNGKLTNIFLEPISFIEYSQAHHLSSYRLVGDGMLDYYEDENLTSYYAIYELKNLSLKDISTIRHFRRGILIQEKNRYFYILVQHFKNTNEMKRYCSYLKSMLSPEASVYDTLTLYGDRIPKLVNPQMICWEFDDEITFDDLDLPFVNDGDTPKGKHTVLDYEHPVFLYVKKHFIDPKGGRLKNTSKSRFKIMYPSGAYYWWDWDNPMILTNDWEKIDLKELFKSTEEGQKINKEFQTERLIEMSKLYNFNTVNIYSQYFRKSPILNDTIMAFMNDDFDILGVKGNMGSGKSAVINLIKYHQKERILYLSVRKTLSSDMKRKYGLRDYRSIDKYNPGDNLVCQVDSLWTKVDSDNFDLVILDEFESLIEHIHTLREKENYIDILTRFLYLLTNKKVVVVDAFLNAHTLESIFGSYVGHRIKILNLFKEDRTPILRTTDNEKFEMLLESALKKKAKDEVITISCSTLEKLKYLRAKIEAEGFICAELSSNTSEKDKKSLMKQMRKEYPKYDVLLYSPSLTVGVEILNNSFAHFHWDKYGPISTLASIQMIKRNRKAKVIVSCVKNYIPKDSMWWKQHKEKPPNLDLVDIKQDYVWDFKLEIEAASNFYKRGHTLYNKLLSLNFRNIKELDSA